MRWLATYKNDDVRVIKRFLFIPCRLANEWRWLETAYIKETYYMGTWLEKQWVSYDEYMIYTVEQAMKSFNISSETVSDFKNAYALTN